jgi:hypothetical protein
MRLFGNSRQEQGSTPILSSSDNTQYSSSIDETYDTQCAWCLQEQGLPMGDGSHGICADHANEMIQSARRRH